MKRLYYLLLMAVAALVTSCAGSQEDITLNNEGVGALGFGIDYAEIPEMIDGQYDRFDRVAEADGFNGLLATYNFYRGDDLVMQHQMYDEHYGFQYVTVFDPAIKTEIGLSVGGDASLIIELDGVADETGMLGGFYVGDYYVCVAKMSDSYLKRAEESYRYGTELTLEASDFTSESVVSSITSYAVE